MKNKPRLLLYFLIALTYALQANAQENTRSPELVQMYNHVEEFIIAKNYPSAITILKQAMILDPENTQLPEALGRVLFLNGQYDEAINTLKAIVEKATADNINTYHYLTLAYLCEGKTKPAMKYADLGLEKFISSGLLYNDKGKINVLNGNNKEALTSYLNGIDHSCIFSENYKDASQIYFKYGKNLLGAIYLEIYLNLPHDTTYDDTLKKQLYQGWENICKYNIVDKNTKKENSVAFWEKPNYEMAISTELFELSPTTSDGVSTENLTMLRTRFVMNYLKKYRATKLDFGLFDWQNEMIKNGKFDIYNEWLFGKAESEAGFNAWNTFHPGDMNRFLAWKVANPYPPLTVSSFLSFDFEDLFKKPKKVKDK